MPALCKSTHVIKPRGLRGLAEPPSRLPVSLAVGGVETGRAYTLDGHCHLKIVDDADPPYSFTTGASGVHQTRPSLANCIGSCR
jgi:hypothetical protein